MALKISEFLKTRAIIMDIKSKEKLKVIEELVDHMVAKKFVKNGKEFRKALAKRENLESTGIGNGIAIPHARTDSVKDLLLAFARSSHGVDFSSIDGKPSYLIFLIASPEKKKSEYIMTLAKLSRLLRKKHVREKLMSAETPKEVLTIIKENEE